MTLLEPSLRSTSKVKAPPAAVPQPRDRRRKRLRLLRRGLAAVALLALAAAAAWAMRPRAVPVELGASTRGPLVVAVEESGMTRVKDRFVVSAPVSGSVTRIALEPGDRVAAGDVLAEIAPALSPLLDPRARAEAEGRLLAALSAVGQARSNVSRAQAALELARQELTRVQGLKAQGATTTQALEQAEFTTRMREEDLESAEYGAKIAQEEVRSARAVLGVDPERQGRGTHATVLAPVSGLVLQVHRRSAGVVVAGTPLLEVGDPAALEVVVDLLTTDAVNVQPGSKVALSGWGEPGTLNGRVRRIEPSGFTRASALGVDEQRVNVVIALTEPRERWARLGDGYRLEVRIVLWQADDVLKAPQGAVFRHGDAWAVYRIDQGRARLTPVRVGHRGEAEVELLSGVAPQTPLVLHPGDRVKDGVRLEAP